ncbi:hypothetical protein ACFLTP_01840 [Chloroflexota bacterium]
MKATRDAGLKVKVNIQPGPVSPVEKTAWCKFWKKLITEVSTEDSFQSHNNIREEPRK